MKKEQKEKIVEILKEYARQFYIWSEESGEEPDVNRFADQICQETKKEIMGEIEKVIMGEFEKMNQRTFDKTMKGKNSSFEVSEKNWEDASFTFEELTENIVKEIIKKI